VADVAAPARGRTRLAALAAGLLLAACAAPLSLDAPAVAELPAPVPDWVAVRATEADDGRRVELARGGSIAVSLRAPTAAGAGWVVAGTPAGLALTGRYTGPVWPPGAPASALAAGAVWQVFVFQARAPGEGRLRFELRGDEAVAPAPPRAVTLGVSVRRG
jgi:hypothetical protein